MAIVLQQMQTACLHIMQSALQVLTVWFGLATQKCSWLVVQHQAFEAPRTALTVNLPVCPSRKTRRFVDTTGEYGKESGPQPRSGQGGMLRFLQHGASSGLSADAVAGSHLPVCNTDSIEAQFAKGRLQHHAADLPNDQASQALLDIKLPPGRVADHTRKRTRHQHPTTLSQSHAKLLKQGAGPMDRLLLKDHSRP